MDAKKAPGAKRSKAKRARLSEADQELLALVAEVEQCAKSVRHMVRNATCGRRNLDRSEGARCPALEQRPVPKDANPCRMARVEQRGGTCVGCIVVGPAAVTRSGPWPRRQEPTNQ